MSLTRQTTTSVHSTWCFGGGFVTSTSQLYVSTPLPGLAHDDRVVVEALMQQALVDHPRELVLDPHHVDGAPRRRAPASGRKGGEGGGCAEKKR